MEHPDHFKTWIALSEVLWDIDTERAEWDRWVAEGNAPDAVLYVGDDGLIRRDAYEAWIKCLTTEEDGEPT